jgi:predicted transcriptional regulator
MDYITFRNEKAKEYREKNKEAIAIRQKEKRDQNRDVINAKAKEYYEKNREAILVRQRETRKHKKEAGLLEFKKILNIEL